MVPKVLMFGWEFPPHNSGGLGVACRGLLRGLSEENVDITFVLPRRIEMDKTNARILFADVSNVDVVEISSTLTPYANSESYARAWSHEKTDELYGNTLLEEVKRYGAKAREIAAREDFDIIHAHDWLSFLAGVEAKRVSGKPLVLHVHATTWDQSGGNGTGGDVYGIERMAMEEADCIITVSNWTKQVVEEHYGISGEKVEVVHNGVEAEEFSYSDIPEVESFKKAGYKAVLFVGRMTIQKGPDYFIDLAAKVLKYAPKTVFIMSGSGDMETQVMHHAAELGISDKIIFTGFLRGEELASVYRMADLFVMPSVSEPFGITPLESLVNGTPVLISKQSGVAEVLQHSLVADFWDIDEMTDKTLSVLQNESLHHTLQENGHTNVLHITWNNAAKKCKSIYDTIISTFQSEKTAK